MNKEKLLVVVGPTAVGKSECGVLLAKHFHGEVISGDSMQIYRGLDVGTAKVTKEEQQGITHHLIDKKAPSETYSAAQFKEDAAQLITSIHKKNKLPIVVGGTGFYIRSLTRDLAFHKSPSDPAFRQEMEKAASEKGAHFLHRQLEEVDPKSAQVIHPNNIKKIIRALEIYHVTGQQRKEFSQQTDAQSPYQLVMLGLTMDRQLLYERINKRVDAMLQDGILEEAKWLYEHYPKDCQAAQAIGYKEFYPYFNGDYSLEQAVQALKKNTRRYAKRQLTWFRNKENVEWFDVTCESAVEKIEEMISCVEGNMF
ncbi:tRNA dimethylallyltransferase [Alteribacillus persepolensis]|uniref:tRNA dimethylallyltransferase n=1 Tax=Alteribacillus persepolensis TaxID=568899 RepID=A0A1G7YVQ9_9BACI|nr:tRNA (adenosine(37)-N6)-dimethylallyltransferase MiaA [Alteribacillus persepolensis]SDH00603.1 tRNA dimethylallyltransferase [Alteribacillus persepolensis]